MTNNLRSKMSLSEDAYSSYSLNKQADKLEIDAGTSYEVFRNHDTAIELIVKDTSMKNLKTSTTSSIGRGVSIRKLQAEINQLKDELNNTNTELESSRNTFKAVTGELKRQLDVASQREYEVQSKNLALQLENEKLQTILESKNSVIDQLRKELISMKRVLKFAIKGLCSVPQVAQNVSFSDLDYEEFEGDLRKDCKVRFAGDSLETGPDTMDSSLLKSSQEASFDKQL